MPPDISIRFLCRDNPESYTFNILAIKNPTAVAFIASNRTGQRALRIAYFWKVTESNWIIQNTPLL